LQPLSKEGAFVEGLGTWIESGVQRKRPGSKKKFHRGVVEVKNYTTFAAPYEGEVIEERG